MNYIVTKYPEFFKKIGKYNFCSLEDMELKETLALDTETTGLFPQSCDIFCVQIGTKKNNYIIHMYDDNYEFSDLAPYLDNKILIFHNALFDLGFMYKYGYYPKEVRDTYMASKILYNGQFEQLEYGWRPVTNAFGACMRRELNQIYDKTTQKNIHLVKLSQDTAIQYSFNDVDRLEELHEALVKKLKANHQMATYELHCRYIKSLAYMEKCGLPINPDKWAAKMVQDVKDTEEWQRKVEEYIYNTLPKFADPQIDMFDMKKRILVKVTSPKQMIDVFKAYDINTLDSKTGKDSIKENIISKSKHPFVKMWLHYQGAKHRVTTFGKTIYDQIEDNRIYTSFNPMVDTARLSSRRGRINFLNFPSDQATRDCFEVQPGNQLIVCDWSGQETVIAADFSGDEAMTKSVVEGADLHCLLARVLFPELEDLTDEVIMTKHTDKRKASKAPRFAMSYGGNAYTLHMNEGIPMKRAVEIEVGFRDLHEGLYDWGNMIFIEAVSDGYIQSVDGWRLKLPKYDMFMESDKEIKAMSRNDWLVYSVGKKEFAAFKESEEKKDEPPYKIKDRKAYDYYRMNARRISEHFKLKSAYQRLCLNSPVQTAGSHQLKLAKAMLFEWIVEHDFIDRVLICNSVHDEIVVEVINPSPEFLEDCRMQLQEFMIEAGNYYLDNLKIKAEAHTGSSWYEAK